MLTSQHLLDGYDSSGALRHDLLKGPVRALALRQAVRGRKAATEWMSHRRMGSKVMLYIRRHPRSRNSLLFLLKTVGLKLQGPAVLRYHLNGIVGDALRDVGLDFQGDLRLTCPAKCTTSEVRFSSSRRRMSIGGCVGGRGRPAMPALPYWCGTPCVEMMPHYVAVWGLIEFLLSFTKMMRIAL